MPLFAYRALAADHRRVTGTLEAASELDLNRRLREANLDLISVKQTNRRGVSWFRYSAPVTARDLIQLCIHIEQLSAAGVPLLDTLNDLREATEHPRLRDILTGVTRDVADGTRLAAAFAKHPRLFGPVFVGLIEAAESTGDYAAAFGQLARHLTWAEELRLRVRRALRYPLTLLTVVTAMIIFLMSFTVPQVVDFLEKSDQKLWLITKALIATSHVIAHGWWLFIGIFGLLVAGFIALRRASSDFALAADRLLLVIPLIGPLVKRVALSRFARMFGVLFTTGIGVIRSLESSGRLIGNRALAAELDRVQQSVEQGASLSEAMSMTGSFPALVIRMVRIGEETGRLPQTLENVSRFYDRDVDEATGRLIGLIEPALLLLVAIIILWIMVGVFGPVYNTAIELSR